MADIQSDFKRRVPGVGKGEELPQPLARREKAEVSHIPDFQKSLENYGESTNWMSALGSAVAMKASNEIATRIGGELGKDPHGDIGPTFTDFDKVMKESYNQQAQATLGIQAQKLIVNSNLELAQEPRLSKEMIAKTQQSTTEGLEKILSMAPSSIRANMEMHYGSAMISQNETLVKRMIGEQKEDRQAALDVSSKINAENAYSLAMNGNIGGSLAALKATTDAANAAAARHDITPLDAKNRIDTARISMLSGKYTREALDADRQKKLPAYLKSLAENPPSDISNTDHDAVYRNVIQSVSQQQQLKSMNDQYQAQLMQNRIVSSPGDITGAEFDSFASQVSPLVAEQVKHSLLQAIKKQLGDNAASNALSQNWANPLAFANASEKDINKAFNDKVNYAVEESQKNVVPLKPRAPLSRDEAEVMVASNAAGQIPVFTKSLKNKLMSPDPMMVESAIQQIHLLRENGNGQALKGLSDQDESMVSAATALRDSPDPIKANQDAHNRIYNQDPAIEKLNKEKLVSLIHKSDMTRDNYALDKVGLKKSDFLNPTLATAYGMNIFEKFSNFYSISGNEKEAVESTQRWVDENYGNTFVNGSKYKTLHPIEKRVGLSSRDAVPYIQYNIAQQLEEKTRSLKEQYDKKQINNYWEVVPVTLPERYQSIKELRMASERLLKLETSKKEMTVTPSSEHGLFFHTYDPIRMKRHIRGIQGERGERIETFDVVLIGNPFGNYDVAIQTKSGMRNLFLEDPSLGIMTVSPNVQSIQEHYNGRNH